MNQLGLVEPVDRLHERVIVSVADRSDRGCDAVQGELVERLHDGRVAIRDGKTKYTNVDGIVELKEAIVAKFQRENGLTYKTSQVNVSPGGKPVIWNAMISTLNPGDEVILPAPYWVSYIELIQMVGGVPVVVNASEAEHFKITPEKLSAAITPKTRAILINSPHNPTGSILRAADLAALKATVDGGANPRDAKVALAQYRFAPRDNLDVDFAARWFSNNEHQMYHEPMGLIDRDRDGVAEWMTRQLRNQIRDNEAFTANGNAVWRVTTGTVEHKVLFGADVYQLDADFTAQTANSADLARGAGPVRGIDLFNPVYGDSTWHDYNLAALPWRSTSTRSKRYGGYLQDELALGTRWHVLAGLRWDGFKDDDRIAGSSVNGNDLSWRLGSTFTVREGLNVYANVASGFVPQSAANQNPAAGGPFDAERSKQWEVGMKSLLADRVTLNMAAYRIDRSNIVQATGEVIGGVNQLAALGLVRSTGMELDLLADLTERWVLNLTYAYNDARVKDAGPNGITNASGDRFANAPRNKLGMWTRYDLPAINSAIGFGMDHVGERVSLDGQTVKAYTVFDMSWKTTWKQWQFQANVKNLFDKVYAASGFIERNGHFPGEPRRVYMQAAYSF